MLSLILVGIILHFGHGFFLYHVDSLTRFLNFRMKNYEENKNIFCSHTYYMNCCLLLTLVVNNMQSVLLLINVCNVSRYTGWTDFAKFEIFLEGKKSWKDKKTPCYSYMLQNL